MKNNKKNIQSILIIGTTIKILGLIYKIISTRILGIEGMRLTSLILPTLSLSLCLSTLSLPTVVNQNIANNTFNQTTKTRTILKSALRITLISSSLISIILLFSFPLYKYIYQNEFIYYPLLICIPLIYISNSTGLLRGYLEANNKFNETYLANLFEQITKISLTFILLFIYRNESVQTKILITFTSMTLSEFASFFYLAVKIKKRNKINYFQVKTNGYEKNILKQALPLTIEQLIITLTNYLEPFIFYYCTSKQNISLLTSTTYYARITSFAIPLLIFALFGVQSIAKFTFPKITANKQNKEIQNTIISKSLFFCFLIALFNFNLCFFYSEEFLNILFKDTSSSEIVHLLSPLYFFIYFNPLFITILQSYEKEKKLMSITFISSSLTLLFIFIFTQIPSININGLIIGMAIGALIKFILLSFFANKEINLPINIKNIILSIFIFFIYFLINTFTHNIYYFATTTLLFYTLILLLYYHLNKNNKKYHHHKKHIKHS